MIDRIIRKDECLQLTGLKASTIAQMEKEGRFPKRHQITGNISGWRESEIQGWIDSVTGRRVDEHKAHPSKTKKSNDLVTEGEF